MIVYCLCKLDLVKRVKNVYIPVRASVLIDDL